MSKLSLEALRERAEAVASENLLATISGGTENEYHCDYTPPGEMNSSWNWQGTGAAYFHMIFGSANCDKHGILNNLKENTMGVKAFSI